MLKMLVELKVPIGNMRGGKYFYLETTGTEWEIGEIPEDWVDVPAVIYDVN